MSNTEKESAISKRPWKNSAKEIQMMTPNGDIERCWMESVTDANGNVVCFGDTADMKFIVCIVNTLDNILHTLKTDKQNLSAAIEAIEAALGNKKE